MRKLLILFSGILIFTSCINNKRNGTPLSIEYAMKMFKEEIIVLPHNMDA